MSKNFINKLKIVFVLFLIFYAKSLVCNAACYVLNLKSTPVSFGFKGRDTKNVMQFGFDKIDIGRFRSGLKVNVVIDKKDRDFVYVNDGIFLFVVMPALQAGQEDEINSFSRADMRKISIEFSKNLASLCNITREAEKIRDFLLSKDKSPLNKGVLNRGAFLEEDAALNIIKVLEKSLDDLLAIKDVKDFGKKDKGLSDIVKKYEEISKAIVSIKSVLDSLADISKKIAGQDGFGKFESIIYKNESFKHLRYLSERPGFNVLKTLADKSLKIVVEDEKYKNGSKKIEAKSSEIEKIKKERDELKKNIDKIEEYNKKIKKIEELKVLFAKEVKESEEKVKTEEPRQEKVVEKKDELEDGDALLKVITDFFTATPENIKTVLENIKIYFKKLSIEVQRSSIEILEKEAEELKKSLTEIKLTEYLEKENELKKVEEEFLLIKEIFMGIQNNLIKKLKQELEDAKNVIWLFEA